MKTWLKNLDDPDLVEYKKIRLRRHDYHLLYRMVSEDTIVDRMFYDFAG